MKENKVKDARIRNKKTRICVCGGVVDLRMEVHLL